jgi:hypothetical protein
MFDVFAVLAVLVAALVVALAYDSEPDDAAIVAWVDITPLARAWRWARAMAARVLALW